MGRTTNEKTEEMTELERLQYENEYLRAENAVLKKLRELRLQGRSQGSTEQQKSFTGLINVFDLRIVLNIGKLSRSTYYYQVKRLTQGDKNKELKEAIQDIYSENKGRYGYRRIHLELKNRGYKVNHKKVQRLMTELGLKARIRAKRRYNSYKGEVGKKADNLIKRQFKAAQPLKKCYTDVTEFSIPASDQKLYLSPVLDGFNSEIIAYHLSTSPNLQQLKTMLSEAFPEQTYQVTILHSDQGWQYQHTYYHHFLEEHGMRPSMSRKGNSLDNGMMESFFGTLKTEMFYGFEKEFTSLETLKTAISEYINYYNTKRIKLTLKGLSPVQYRTQSLT
ncbi:transposase [Streptococcus dysgalactiae subsp. equisimilis GGS_124]|nr:transposase [Streptococcus dysgalactiae subsp. equisimilis GGS_124]